MGDLEKANWKKANGKSISNISDKDVKAIFRICDTDKSGSISDRVGRIIWKVQERKSFALHYIETAAKAPTGILVKILVGYCCQSSQRHQAKHFTPRRPKWDSSC